MNLYFIMLNKINKYIYLCSFNLIFVFNNLITFLTSFFATVVFPSGNGISSLSFSGEVAPFDCQDWFDQAYVHLLTWICGDHIERDHFSTRRLDNNRKRHLFILLPFRVEWVNGSEGQILFVKICLLHNGHFYLVLIKNYFGISVNLFCKDFC